MAPIFSRQSAHRWRWGYELHAPTVLYPQEDPWYSFLLEASRPQGHSAAGRVRSTEKANDLIGNRTHDFPACSIVPEPTTLPRAPHEPAVLFWCPWIACVCWLTHPTRSNLRQRHKKRRTALQCAADPIITTTCTPELMMASYADTRSVKLTRKRRKNSNRRCTKTA
jgi:hypothetical protein